MKMKCNHLLSASLILFAASLPVQAAIYNWDGNTGTANAQDGSGTWNTSNTNWITPSTTGTDVVWANSNIATFGVSADGTYAVTVATSPTATLAFNYSGYTLSAASAQTITFGGNVTGINVAAGKSATIGNNVTVALPNIEANYNIGVTSSSGGTLFIDNGGTVFNNANTISNYLSINRTTVEVMTGGSLTTKDFGSGTGNAIFVNGLVKVTGGAVTSYGTLGIGQINTAGNEGTLTISSGSVTATSANGVRFGANAGTLGGTVNLDGGSLSTTKFIRGTTAPTTAVLNLNGGTLKPTAGATTDWIASGITTNVLAGGAIIDTTAASVTINRNLVHGGSGTDGGLTKLGAGTLNLGGASTYNGATAIKNGTLALGTGNDRLPTGTTVTLGDGTTHDSGVLKLDSRSQQLAGLLTAGTGTGNRVVNGNATAATLTLNIAGTNAFGGSLGGSGMNENNFALTKTGEGTLTLGGSNTYTGATNVNAGKLVVNGSISTSILTTVAPGAALGGSATVGALTIASGGSITPGNSPGAVVVNGAYIQAGQYTADIAGTTAVSGYDQIDVTGSVDITGGSLVTMFSGVGYNIGDLVFILLNDSNDTINGTYTGLAQGSTVATFGGFDWQISYTADSAGSGAFIGGNDIALKAIPEPNVASMFGGLGVLALLRRRR
jgi:autotransporter-associated beta strand protein